MRIGRSASLGAQTRVVVVTADAAFEKASARLSAPAPRSSSTSSRERSRIRITSMSKARASSLPISIPATNWSCRRSSAFMARIGSWPPVVAVTRSFEGNVARRLMQMRVADFLIKPVPPVDLVQTCARVAKPPASADANGSADLHLPAGGRRRRRDHARGADRDASSQQRRARQDRDLPGRSRFSARRLRRLSRHRAASQSQRDRAAPGAARPAIA